jgi:hypothetical protein
MASHWKTHIMSVPIADTIDNVEAAKAIRVKPQTQAVWRLTKRYGLAFVKFDRPVR